MVKHRDEILPPLNFDALDKLNRPGGQPNTDEASRRPERQRMSRRKKVAMALGVAVAAVAATVSSVVALGGNGNNKKTSSNREPSGVTTPSTSPPATTPETEPAPPTQPPIDAAEQKGDGYELKPATGDNAYEVVSALEGNLECAIALNDPECLDLYTQEPGLAATIRVEMNEYAAEKAKRGFLLDYRLRGTPESTDPQLMLSDPNGSLVRKTVTEEIGGRVTEFQIDVVLVKRPVLYNGNVVEAWTVASEDIISQDEVSPGPPQEVIDDF